ncbi:388_t:CDS:10 [Ambispora gerdemannii]|uniref:388_t:CDS:1 n=1 Tax=Ambispora gerdemannii TaxID=144530 RepID=A0A9N8VE10_9GLOM|nr:388_t:CDS:10 [Ambispora gerdemannii]
MSSQSLLSIGLQVREEALSTLREMGIPELDAVNALRKFDNNVERAIDYIFSGQSTLDELPHLVSTNDSTEPMNTDSHDWKNSSTPKSDTPFNVQDAAATNNSAIDLTGDESADIDMALRASIHDQNEADLKRGVEKSLADSRPQSANGNYDAKALVLYHPTKEDTHQRPYQRSYQDPWGDWTDPENPAHRTRDTFVDTPLGLRPFPEHYFATCIFQALFHIPIFRISVLGFRPTRENWGNVEGYWQGKSSRLSDEQDLISSHSSEYRRYSKKYVSLNVVHEMQKLFVFLMLSGRSYGDSRYIMEAIEFKENKDTWPEFSEALGEFYESLFNRLCEASRFNDKDALENDEHAKGLVSYINSFDTKIVIFHLMRKDSNDKYSMNSTYYSNTPFSLDKILYMDRYLIQNKDEVSSCWQIIETLEQDLQRTKQEIDNITNFEGNSNGLDLLQGSISYYERKRDTIEPTDTESIERISSVINFLEKFKTRTEERLKGFMTHYDELHHHLQTVYDRPSLTQIPYRLCAVIIHDEMHNGNNGNNSNNDWAYIWIPKDKSENYEVGDWWKFQNTEVKKVAEEQVFRDDAGANYNAGIHTLIYVHPDCLYNFPDSFYEPLIPTTLKEFVRVDNDAFKQEFINYKERMDPPAYSPVDAGGRTDEQWNSDSTTNFSSNENTPHDFQHKYSQIEIQARDLRNDDYRIVQRFELFCARLRQSELTQTLLKEYLETNRRETSWDDDPLPLDPKYREDPKFKKILVAFERYEEITMWFTEGLERMKFDEYANAFEAFLHTLQLEERWIDFIQTEDDISGLPLVNNSNIEEIKRSHYVVEHAKICLQTMHQSALDKANNPNNMNAGIRDALILLKHFIRILGPDLLNDDRMFVRIREDWLNFTEQTVEGLDDEKVNAMEKLVASYAAPEILDIQKYQDIDEVEPIRFLPEADDEPLYKRYGKALKVCKELFGGKYGGTYGSEMMLD